MTQPPYGQDPYGQQPYGQDPNGQQPYGQQPYGQDPYGAQQPTTGGTGYGSGYQGIPDSYAQPDPYAQADPYGQAAYAAPQPGYGMGGPVGPPPSKNNQLPLIIGAIALVVAIGVGVLVFVLNRSDDPVAGPSGQSTVSTTAAPSSETSSSSESSPSDESASASETSDGSGGSDAGATPAEAKAQTEEFMELVTAGDEKAKIYVCSPDQKAFADKQASGEYDALNGADFTVEEPTVDGDKTVVTVEVTGSADTATFQFAMSYSGKYWYWCPSDQPGVGTQI